MWRMSFRGPDPHNLRRLAQKAAPIIETDRECAGCGYNLRGLRLGINCPECGLPSTAPLNSDDPLSLMPTRVIVTFVRGCWVGSICVLLMVIMMLLERFGAIGHSPAMTALAGLSLVWLVAAIWLTPAFDLPQAVSRGFCRKSRLRAAARWLQFGWPAACAAALGAHYVTGPLSALLTMITILSLVAALTGLAVMAVLLERLAEWARDEDAQKMFNWTIFCWPLALLLYIPIQFLIGSWLGLGAFRVISGIMVILWVFAIATFPCGLLMLAKSVTLSILHSLEHREREQRRFERKERFSQQKAEAVLRGDRKRMYD
jgi:small-conductance mechanosensitive channel